MTTSFEYRDQVEKLLRSHNYGGIMNRAEVTLMLDHFNAGDPATAAAARIIVRRISATPDMLIPIEPVAAVTKTARWHLKCACSSDEQKIYLEDGWEPFAVDKDFDVWFRKWSAD